ncbi:MAG: DUF2156 domain-containing protein [Desulfobacterales bacterium]
MEHAAPNLDGLERYRRLLARTPQVTSDYSFVNVWSWAGEYGLQWEDDGDLIWLRQTTPEEAFWAPVGDWKSIDWERRMSDFASGTRFIRIPEALVALWRDALPGRFDISEERGQWDYVYRVQELVELKGKQFHKKKNLLNQFKKSYDYRYAPLNAKLVEQALALQDDWCTWRDCESDDVLSAENRAIQKALESWHRLPGLQGGSILVDGYIVAYTVAEPLDADSIVIHFEKGCTAHKGVYQAINQMFLESLQGEFEFVNREQDLGDEGLRKAKLSYNPSRLLKKYRATLH